MSYLKSFVASDAKLMQIHFVLAYAVNVFQYLLCVKPLTKAENIAFRYNNYKNILTPALY
jgi:hypothetical protein